MKWINRIEFQSSNDKPFLWSQSNVILNHGASVFMSTLTVHQLIPLLPFSGFQQMQQGQVRV